ncbi:MAG: selenium metabolism-associated LysR family transcriptional regulator [Desulfobacteraceae bacterium]|nr:selenium metabolism-associated LysR family transcriptional regulator [Desulfobacteraceae bacterium]
MDLHRLEVFCRVVELKSFTKAAEAVYLSQPTVSEHLRSLEEMVGQKLVDRLGREVLPTPAGQILYRYALQLLQLRQEATQALQQFSGTLAGHLTLGASTIPGTYILPALIGTFKARYPDIQTTLRIANSRLTAEGVLNGELEMGVIGARWNEPGLEWEEMFEDELVITVHPEHPWAKRRKVRLPELLQEPFIMRERFSGTRRVMSQILEEHGADLSRLPVVAEMGSTEAVRQSIKARIGVSILSRHAVAEDVERNTLVTVALEGIRLRRPIFLIKRRQRELSPLCSAFLQHLRAASPANP